MSGGDSGARSPLPYADPQAQLATFRAYQRTGTYRGAAAELGLSEAALKKRLGRLYERIGAHNAIHASYLLRKEPY